MEITGPTSAENRAAALYRHEQDELRQRFCEAYHAWRNVDMSVAWWHMEREKAWDRYLIARRAWTGY